MKTFYLTFFIYLISVTSLASDLPNLENFTRQGRVPIFLGVSENNWVLPTLFSTSLTCSPGQVSEYVSCSVKVLNYLSDEDKVKIEATGKSMKWLSPFDAGIGAQVNEHFEWSLDANRSSELLLKNLALQDVKHLYAGVLIRFPKEKWSEISKQYEQDGLGKFVSQVSFLGERVYDFVAIENMSVIKSLLSPYSGKLLDSKNATVLIEKATSLAMVEHVGYEPEELQKYLSYEIKRKLFARKPGAKFMVNGAYLAVLPEKWILQSVISEPERVNCVAEIKIKKNAVPTLRCDFVDGGQ